MKSLPPVSPTIRGYERRFSRLFATSFHSLRKTPVEPVKCTPASSGCDIQMSPTTLAFPGMKLITPAGSPASIINFINL